MCLLNKEIHKFALKHQQDEGLKDLNEAQVRNTIIKPLLRILGWDDGSVTVEAATGIFHSVKHADYVLRCKGTQTPFAALEVKRPSFPLYNPKECPQEAKWEMEKWLCQSLNYSLLLGTGFTVLSNGPQWLVLETFEPGVSAFERAVLWFPSFLHIADHADIFALISEASVQDGDFHNFVHIQKQKHTAGHFCYLNKEGVDDLCRQLYISKLVTRLITTRKYSIYLDTYGEQTLFRLL